MGGPLSDEDARNIVKASKDNSLALSLDYVFGRACKIVVFKDGDTLTIRDSWYDHTNQQLDELLSEFGFNRGGKSIKHGCSCNCKDCQKN